MLETLKFLIKEAWYDATHRSKFKTYKFAFLYSISIALVLVGSLALLVVADIQPLSAAKYVGFIFGLLVGVVMDFVEWVLRKLEERGGEDG